MSADSSTQTLYAPASTFSMPSTRTKRSHSLNDLPVDNFRSQYHPSNPSTAAGSSTQTRVDDHGKRGRPPSLTLEKQSQSPGQTVISKGPTTAQDPSELAISEEYFLSDAEAKVVQGHLDAIVIVAALLLAVDAGFVIEGLKLLEPNPLERDIQLLYSLMLIAHANTTADLTDLLHPKPFVPDPHSIQVNRCLVTSFCLCLAAVCGAMGGKDATLHGAQRAGSDQNLGRTGVRILLILLHQLMFWAVVAFFVGFIKQAAHLDPSIKNLALGFGIVSLLLYLTPGSIRHLFRIIHEAKSHNCPFVSNT